LKLRLSKRFVWKCQYAVRAQKKGRAKGGIITGVRKGINENNVENESDRWNTGEEAEAKEATLENNIGLKQ